MAWREEHSFQFWLYMDLVSSGLALWLPIDMTLRVIILCLGILVLAAECFNTAIERVVDYQSACPGFKSLYHYQNPVQKSQHTQALTAMVCYLVEL